MKHGERLERVAFLASRLLDGLASAEERAELNELLRGDPENCERYLDLAETHALLAREHVGDTLAEEVSGIPPFAIAGERSAPRKRTASSQMMWRFLGAAAAVVLLANGHVLWTN